MKTVKLKRHWLSNATPKYWTPRKLWRVRAMREGRHFQWLLKCGRGDATATGAAIATAEWTAIRADIIRAERVHNANGDGMGFVGFKSADDEHRYALGVQARAWAADEIISATVATDEWAEFQEWRRLKAESTGANAATSATSATSPTRPMLRRFSELTAIFRAALDARLSATKEGMKLKGDISKARHTQYVYALAHMDSVVGETAIEPSGDYQLSAARMAVILGTYRTKCETEMAASEFSGHWFNERMKTARMLATYLHQHGLLDALPSNIERMTEKYRIEANPKPIPLDVLKAIWGAADEQFKGFMLLALNLGFRQTEIASIERKHVKVIGGQLCIEKRRGKTGVPLAIPLWKSTHRFIEKYGAVGGRLFLFDDEPTHKSAIDALYHRMVKVRNKASKSVATAKDFSFENFRDTGASFIESINPMLTPLYLGQSDTRNAKWYVGQIANGDGHAVVPMQLDKALAEFEKYLSLPNAGA
ncbi:MAG TPA: site-specific integrase [Tepidisphaeraceae bacterium]|jgi:hypothetical protein|nr:site-specific integrase [Tepidisphaeraceae bacterium]